MRQFYILSPNSSCASFHCRSYARFRYKKGFCGHDHRHAYSEIFFITDGKGFFHLRERKVPIHRGMVIINNGNIQHAESSHPDEELEYAILSVENLSFSLSHTAESENTFFLDFTREYEAVFDFIRKIEWEWSIQEPFWQYALQSQFNSYILFILRSANLLALPVRDSNSPNPLAKVRLYLTANYEEDITLDKLADIFCMNKYYLAHTFKDIYGDSIIHTLNQIRCQTARHLLQNCDLPISEISMGVGYNSSSYFTKIYQRFYGETPLQTRKLSFKEGISLPE